jgi:hypothetical protein
VRDRAPEALGAAVALLVAAAGAVLLAGGRRSAAPDGPGADLRRLTGGIGGGTASSLRPCDRAFDPGIAGTCGPGVEGVPGGFAWCPHHSGASLRR